jgi:hypothetical protein
MRARPMSTVQVVGEVIVALISPASVLIENVFCSLQRWRLRYRIASRAPLPESSASEPSGLKIRRLATNPGSSAADSSRIPSEATPVCAAHRRLTRSGVSSNGSVRSSKIT